LWEIDDALIACVDALEKEKLYAFTPPDLVSFFRAHGCADLFVDWTDSQVKTSAREGKIPSLQNWRTVLESKSIGLDSLMNLVGLNSFAADQEAMDDRIRACLS
jgi:hypothetical protein